MRARPFVKLSGAGNDFILINAADFKNTGPYPALARRLCARRLGIGADGLLVLNKRGARGVPEAFYFNADGSKAFCANGTRCAAWWMRDEGWVKDHFSIYSNGMALSGRISGRERVRLSMPPAHGFHMKMPVRLANKIYVADFMDTGSPHAVARVKNLDAFPVVEIGQALRRHKIFSPAGTNVDFVEIRGNSVRIRTYERGVEDETLACGTGAVAAALMTHLWIGRRSPISISTRGGLLRVYFKTLAPKQFDDIELEGPVQLTFRGEINL